MRIYLSADCSYLCTSYVDADTQTRVQTHIYSQQQSDMLAEAATDIVELRGPHLNFSGYTNDQS
jgi:hypothetical protein